MFERRLKIFLSILILLTVAMALRAMQIQVIQHDYWTEQAAKQARHIDLLETTRGPILDRNGKVLADDAPCIDASVDYRAITEEPDLAWLSGHAVRNLKDRLGKDFKSPKSVEGKQQLKDEIERVRGDIDAMWTELAVVGNQTPEQIEDTRRAIVAQVEMRKRYIWWRSFDLAQTRSEKDVSNNEWYRRFLSSNGSEESKIDQFKVDVAEETSMHLILHNVSPEVQARLARQQERFFGLGLLPGKYREYPYGASTCHVVGYMGPIRPNELGKGDPFRDDELRNYQQNDVVGRSGVEALCEPQLRGVRGRVEHEAESKEELDRVEAQPGHSVHLTIDADLQKDLQHELIKPRRHINKETGAIEPERSNQHAAIVVIKPDTGEVLALVSNPGYDPAQLQSEYSVLAADDLNRPLLDRATQMAVEPGSTVKPIVAVGGITHNFVTPETRIKCDGYLWIDGKRMPHNRCWTVEAFKKTGLPPSHRAASGDLSLSPDDTLTISDGLKNSCDVVFETIADKMRMKELSYWFDQFGLGRTTGIGIEESAGRLFRPSDEHPGAELRAMAWSAGIGEGVVHATPIQMANVAATFARKGIWMRPKLVEDLGANISDSQTRPSPDRVDLQLPTSALDAVQKGMEGVCDPNGTGTGFYILPDVVDRGPNDPPAEQDPLRNIRIAGKTGSAQTGQLLKIFDRSADGQIKRDASGNPIYHQVKFGEPGTEGWYVPPTDPDPDQRVPHVWDPAQHTAHAWFIGYAPAEHPQVAFCVLVEYGEAGGPVAGTIAHDVLVDCVRHHYLSAGN